MLLLEQTMSGLKAGALSYVTLGLTIYPRARYGAGAQRPLSERRNTDILLSEGRIGVGHDREWDPEIAWVPWDLLY